MVKLIRVLILSSVFVLAGCFSPDSETLTSTQPAPILTPNATALPQSFSGVQHPLSIETMRNRTYNGSLITFEETLAPGSNYNQYVVSYLSDGLKIYALMTIPQDPRPAGGYPVVIFNHGYIPPDQYRTTERYVAYVDAFASSGYIVFKSDYRGHGSSEGNPVSAYTEPGYTEDVLNAVATMRMYPDANPNQIAMWGHSMGGYITLRAMVIDPTIRAGVIWAGVIGSYPELMESWFSRRPNSWRERIIEEYGTPEQNPTFWNAISANSYLDSLNGRPIQLHHGTNDSDVPYIYSIQVDEQLRAAGQISELLIYPNDDHNISANRDGALAVSVVFLNRYVLNR